MEKFFTSGAEIFRWGPIPGNQAYNSDFGLGFFPNLLKPYDNIAWPKSLFLFRKRQMVYLCDFAQLRTIGQHVFVEHMVPVKARQALRAEWDRCQDALVAHQHKLEIMSFDNLQINYLAQLWEEFYRLLREYWSVTFVQELANYGSVEFLSKELSRYIPGNQLAHVVEVLTTPTEMSFFQREEIDLSECKDLVSHQQKYFWINNSYFSVQSMPVSFFEKRKKDLSSELRKAVQNHIKHNVREKKELQIKYSLPKRIMDISQSICIGINWQDERKEHIWRILAVKEKVLLEIQRRFNLAIDDLRLLLTSDILALLKTGDIAAVQKIFADRATICGVAYVEREPTILTADIAQKYWDMYAVEKAKLYQTSATGIVASKTSEKIVRGVAKILQSAAEMDKLTADDILITSMTSPEFVFAMKKAKAIVTDNGGLTSHAAIVSRELKKICIVGTRVATSVFKDGDLIELDTNTGTVRLCDLQVQK